MTPLQPQHRDGYDDPVIHVLELTKLTAKRENLESATPAERWAYFLLNAENLTVAEILEMIKDNPDQMSDYISRLKYKLDEGWRIESTRAEALREGREEGMKEGELIGQIVILQELLGMTEPDRKDLSNYDASQLTY